MLGFALVDGLHDKSKLVIISRNLLQGGRIGRRLSESKHARAERFFSGDKDVVYRRRGLSVGMKAWVDTDCVREFDRGEWLEMGGDGVGNSGEEDRILLEDLK